MTSESTNPFLDLAHWPEWHSGQFRSITILAPDKLTIEHGDTQEVALQGMTFSPTRRFLGLILPSHSGELGVRARIAGSSMSIGSALN